MENTITAMDKIMDDHPSDIGDGDQQDLRQRFLLRRVVAEQVKDLFTGTPRVRKDAALWFQRMDCRAVCKAANVNYETLHGELKNLLGLPSRAQQVFHARAILDRLRDLRSAA